MIRFNFGTQYLLPFRPGGHSQFRVSAPGSGFLSNVRSYQALDLDDDKFITLVNGESARHSQCDLKCQMIAHHPDYAAGMFNGADSLEGNKVGCVGVSLDFRDAKFVYQAGCSVVAKPGYNTPVLVRPFIGYRVERPGNADTARDHAVILIKQFLPFRHDSVQVDGTGSRHVTVCSCEQWIVDAFGTPGADAGTAKGRIPHAAAGAPIAWSGGNTVSVPTELVFGVRFCYAFADTNSSDCEVVGSLWFNRNKGVDPDTIQLVA